VVDLVHWGHTATGPTTQEHTSTGGLPHMGGPQYGPTISSSMQEERHIHIKGDTHGFPQHTQSPPSGPRFVTSLPVIAFLLCQIKKHHFDFGMGLGIRAKLLCVQIDCVVQWNPTGWTLCGWGSMCGLDCVSLEFALNYFRH
jgi:hypothetical protein